MNYWEFNYLVKHSIAVFTSETTFLGVRCKTLCDKTERPETVAVVIATNELIGTDTLVMEQAMNIRFEGKWKKVRHLNYGITKPLIAQLISC